MKPRYQTVESIQLGTVFEARGKRWIKVSPFKHRGNVYKAIATSTGTPVSPVTDLLQIDDIALVKVMPGQAAFGNTMLERLLESVSDA